MHPLDQIAHVQRELSEHGSTQSVILTRTFDTTAKNLWDACTSPERLPHWFEPVSGELREGGRYRLDGSGSEGSIQRCEPPSRLSVTWEYEGEISHVELAIHESDGRATARLTHLVPVDAHWETYGPAATGVGWDSAFLSLALYLAGDPRAEPSEMEVFSASPEGIEFVRRTAEAWADVHVTAGTDPDQARTAAENTIAAYTGVEQVE
jgi:uncharacterized protein YndB with AHSA1/START domain